MGLSGPRKRLRPVRCGSRWKAGQGALAKPPGGMTSNAISPTEFPPLDVMVIRPRWPPGASPAVSTATPTRVAPSASREPLWGSSRSQFSSLATVHSSLPPPPFWIRKRQTAIWPCSNLPRSQLGGSGSVCSWGAGGERPKEGETTSKSIRSQVTLLRGASDIVFLQGRIISS